MGLGDIIYEVRVCRGDPRIRTLLHLEIWKDRGSGKTELYVIPGFPLFISLTRPFIGIWMVNITSCGARLTQVKVHSSVQSLSHVQLFATHGLQHARLPCPSPTPGACSNSCPSSRGCHPAISSSVIPFSSCLQSFPASGSYK